jgi:glycosyltransferase involved in cell wall biosynthesis
MVARRAARPVAMVCHTYNEEDPRVRREAEALVAAGRPVDVFALRPPGAAADGTVAGVTVHRLGVQRHQGAGLGTYVREYLDFFARAGWAVARAHRHRRYALVQVHTLPDFLALAMLPLRLAGVPVLLDLHEAMPEFFRSRFPRAANPLVHRALVAQERLSIGAASHAITVNDALRDRLVGLGVPPDRVGVVPNAPSLGRFDPAAHPARTFAEDGVVRLVYAGAITPVYELDVVVDALARIADARPDLGLVLDVYGRGDSLPRIVEQVERLGLTEQVSFHGRIPLDDVPAAIARADIGVAPTRRDAFTDVSLSTKIFEYAAMGKAAVCSRLPLVDRTFAPGTVERYEPGDPDDLAAAILRVVDDPAARDVGIARTRELVEQRSWEREAVHYRSIVDGLAAGPRP